MADTSTGWVKLFRSFTKWEWYTDANVMRVFVHLILIANIEPKRWRGVDINVGQVVTSLNHLANALCMDKHTVKRSLDKLKMTGEISVTCTKKFSIITVSQYDTLQHCRTTIAPQLHQSRTTRAPLAHPTKELQRMIKNDKEDIPPSADSACAENGGAENFTGWRAREGHDF